MTTENAGTTALAKRDALVPEVITNPTEFKQYLRRWDEAQYHVLTPQVDFGSLPPQWTIVPSAVRLDPNPDNSETYFDKLFCKPNEVAPTKMGLRKIARGAGISWNVERVDSGTVQNYWAMRCTIEYRGFDGLMKHAEASYEWDLRDGSARVKTMSSAELNRARLNGYRRCEAGAINAAIREYGLKQKYSREELSKPFVTLNLVFNPDMSDPQQKAAVLQSALSNTKLLYGGTTTVEGDAPATSPRGPGPVVGTFRPDDPEPVERDLDEIEASKNGTAQPKGELVARVQGIGEPVHTYAVTMENGKVLHTKDLGVATACNKARKEQRRIEISAEIKEHDQLWINEVSLAEQL